MFNLTRNLGGAIGIALIDTLLQSRTPGHADALVSRLQAGDATAARLVGLPTALFRGHAMGPVDPMTKAMIDDVVQCFADAAVRCRDAGLDGGQTEAAGADPQGHGRS